jgi:N-acetylmuramoyl-L-alanine amidase
MLNKAASLIPILVLMLVSVNLYIFVEASGRLMPEHQEAPEVLAGIVSAADAAGIGYDNLNVKLDNGDGNQSQIEPDEVVSALEEEFGSDAAFLAAASSPPASKADRPKQQEEYITYQVARGDSLYQIAQLFGTTITRIMEINELKSTTIKVNQHLLIPDNGAKEYPVGLWLTDQEVQWIAQMIHAEARGEPYLGQVAVGAVIINRIKSPKFPNTVQGVLFQDGAFQPVRNGAFYQPASEQAYRVALEALNGNDPTNGALFFFNPSISNDRFMHSRTPAVTIGQHRFAY